MRKVRKGKHRLCYYFLLLKVKAVWICLHNADICLAILSTGGDSLLSGTFRAYFTYGVSQVYVVISETSS